MTLDEFRALKAGDVVRNPMAHSVGKVASVVESGGRHGVEVLWGDTTQGYRYSEMTTAWMHWTVESEDVE